MSNEIEDKPKKRGHRKKKFGDQESKVISFRIGKDTYDKNKKTIREKINTVIESEEIKKNLIKKNKENSNSYFERFRNINIEKKQVQEEEDVKEINKQKENEEKVFVIDREIYDQRDYKKEFIEKSEPELTERDKLDLREAYEQYREAVEEQVQEEVKEINKQGVKEIKDKKDLFEEFKDFIDPNNKEFKEFMD